MKSERREILDPMIGIAWADCLGGLPGLPGLAGRIGGPRDWRAGLAGRGWLGNRAWAMKVAPPGSLNVQEKVGQEAPVCRNIGSNQF